MKLMRLFAVLVVLSALMFTACASSNTTKVTINFSKAGQVSLEQKKIPLMDRFLNLFSSEAYAQPKYQPGDTMSYLLYVTADDIDAVFAEALGDASSIDIDVPSGDNRVFTLLSFSSDGYYNYIGQTVENLSGDAVNITMNMYPCLYNIKATWTTGNAVTVTWNYDSTLHGKFSTISVYRACFGSDPSCDGRITSLGSVANLDDGTASVPPYHGTYPDTINLCSTGNQTFIYLLSVDPINFPGISFEGNFLDIFINNQFIPIYLMTSFDGNPCG